MADLCGATVTLQAGTIHEELVDAQQADCGARPIKARPLESGTQVVLEVKFGRADAALADFPVAAYNAKVSGQGRDFQVVGEQIDPGPLRHRRPQGRRRPPVGPPGGPAGHHRGRQLRPRPHQVERHRRRPQDAPR